MVKANYEKIGTTIKRLEIFVATHQPGFISAKKSANLDRLTAKIFKKVAYRVEQEKPIPNPLYERISDVLYAILELDIPDALAGRVFRRAEYIEIFCGKW